MAVINGTSGNNTLNGTTGADQINGLGGNDVINALSRSAAVGTGFDVIDGGDGNDTLVVDASGETQTVQLNAGFSPRYTLSSASGNFIVEAYNIEMVKFTGGSGDDIINTSDGEGTVNGGGGIDWWIADLSDVFSNVNYKLGTTTQISAAGLTSILNIERMNLTTGAGNDRITGGAQADFISTGDGDDTIDLKTRMTGTDVADGGAGIDTLVVNASAETQAVTLSVGGSPAYSVNSTSGKFTIEAFGVEKVKFTGGAGNDTINTGAGGMTVNGGGGIDSWLADLGQLTSGVTFTLGTTTKISAAGLESILNIEQINLTTGAGNDRITGGAQADFISTGDGDDTIDLKTRTTGTDVAVGGAGIDTLVVDASAETQAVTLGVGGSPTYAVNSTSGNFTIEAYGVEKVKFTGGAGNDTINTGAGGVTVDGGSGIDHWLADLGQLTSGVAFTLGTTTKISAAGLTSVLNIERMNLTTGSGNDTITGGSQADFIITGHGNDTIDLKTRTTGTDVADGGAGIDTLVVDASSETQAVTLGVGGSPAFVVNSTSGNFTIEAYGVEKVKFTGGSGNDTINTGAGGVTVDGGSGIDHWIANLGQLTSGVTFTLGTTASIAAAGLTSILNIERLNLTTGSSSDTITGGAQADFISTGHGNDTIDLKTRASGTDVADGGAGIDTLVVDASAETQAVTLGVGGSPTFVVNSTSGKFSLEGYNMEKVVFTGGAGNDTASGSRLTDVLMGGGGNDTLNGGDGDDTLNGGLNNDLLRGGRDADSMIGGGGSDVFDFDLLADSSLISGKIDSITDFVSGVDDIDLADIDANARTWDGNQAFSFIGGGSFTGARGELRSVAGIVEADLNGDAVADFQILLTNGASALLADFLL